jgi:hypothetical protein
MYGLTFSSTIHNVDFSCILAGRGWYNLNKISYPESTLFKATLTATT